MAVTIEDDVMHDVLVSVPERPFHTAQFIDVFKVRHGALWLALVTEYGEGGRGAGRHYSAFSRVAQALHHLSERGDLSKLDYEPVPPDLDYWGSPVIRYWTDDREAVGQLFPEDVGEEDGYFEGAKIKVTVNRYERNLEARQSCIDHHGDSCKACGINFAKMYGERGRGFIHVHHTTPISTIGKTYEVDPVNDLVPLCPNCHAMIHRRDPMLTVEELAAIVQQRN